MYQRDGNPPIFQFTLYTTGRMSGWPSILESEEALGTSLKIIQSQSTRTTGISATTLFIMKLRSEKPTLLSVEKMRPILIRDKDFITKVTGALEHAMSISMKMFLKRLSQGIGPMQQIGHQERFLKKVKMFILSPDGT